MPELPDLEVLRDNLTLRIVGRTIRGVEVYRTGLVRTGPDSIAVEGRTFSQIGRRGKHLIFSFHGGPHLIVHLMRWGWLWHGPASYPPSRATILRLALDDGFDLRLIEPGGQPLAAAWVVPDPATAEPLRKLGVEPLSDAFTWDAFRALLAGRRRPLKKVLTDQHLIAGIGNAYADEVLFAAKLSPVRYAHTLTEGEQERLWQAIPEALRWAIAEIKKRVGDGLFDKEVRDFLYVHGRAGNPCRVCGTPVGEILFDDQRTDFCPRCQGVNQPMRGA
ncbi:Fpg/Nei family DNA glycosylase [Candidatus Bipolaricaulota bacterium]|nr:Fpg/Nei family DNA glycosylase [Candidatus Bipolaricaulota bacterium]